MVLPPLEPGEGVSLLGELVRLTAPPALEEEICDQGGALLGRALGASAAVLVLHGQGGEPTFWGNGPAVEMIAAGQKTRRSADLLEDTAGEGGTPSRVVLALPGRGSTVGALVLERPARWSATARVVLRTAGQILGATLESARALRQSHTQGELLVQRNVELESLRELIARLQELGDEDEMLQASLDLVLEKMGLSAGWIFWAEGERDELHLAACRGIAAGFVKKAREGGIGTCLCRDVFASGKRTVARNTVECPRLPDLLESDERISHACIPLKFQRGTRGVLNIANLPGRLFSAQELQFLETIGNQICLAVDRARTNLAESRRNAEARALVSLARAIGGSLDPERVLAAVGDYARELLNADRCAIFLGEVASRPPLLAYLSGPPLEGLEVGRSVDLVSLGSRAIVEAWRVRRTIVIQDVQNDPRANAALARRWSVGSEILVPLIAHDRLEGMIMVSRKAASTWSLEEVALADALAGQAAVAIESARLYRQLEENLRKLQEAQFGMMRAERLAAVGTLASSLAHEVRNPLNSIGLQLVLLSRRIAKLDESKRSELDQLVETSRREIQRLNDLVEEFLSMATLDRLSLAESDPREVLREVTGLMSPVAKQRGVALRSSPGPKAPPIRMDREKIRQVLINLVRNAIEAISDGGVVTLTLERSEDELTIRVADTGIGIAPGTDVFDFFTTTKRGGTGLGLPISRRIVEAHGGSLDYESAPGRGTVFSVTLKTREREALPGGVAVP